MDNKEIVRNAVEVVKARAQAGSVSNDVLLELLAKSIKLLRGTVGTPSTNEDTEYLKSFADK